MFVHDPCVRYCVGEGIGVGEGVKGTSKTSTMFLGGMTREEHAIPFIWGLCQICTSGAPWMERVRTDGRSFFKQAGVSQQTPSVLGVETQG